MGKGSERPVSWSRPPIFKAAELELNPGFVDFKLVYLSMTP